MRRSTAYVSLAAVPLWWACAAAATGQTGPAINEPVGQTAVFPGDAVGFVETRRPSLVVPGPLPPVRVARHRGRAADAGTHVAGFSNVPAAVRASRRCFNYGCRATRRAVRGARGR